MERYWLRREASQRLVVFVLGWAADHRVVEHIKTSDCDVLCIYDYRNIEPLSRAELAAIERYSERLLFAWSFGVWAAERILGDVEFDNAVALNGTPFPVDERYGIEPRRIDVTIRGIEKGGMEAFNRRAYGEYYSILRGVLSPRTTEQNVAELTALKNESMKPYEPAIAWREAVVGEHDVIFMPENMVNYWGERAQVLPLPHYPFADEQLILKYIDHR